MMYALGAIQGTRATPARKRSSHRGETRLGRGIAGAWGPGRWPEVRASDPVTGRLQIHEAEALLVPLDHDDVALGKAGVALRAEVEDAADAPVVARLFEGWQQLVGPPRRGPGPGGGRPAPPLPP